MASTAIDLTILIPVRATTPAHVGWLHEAVASVDYRARILIADDGSTEDLREAEMPDALVYRLSPANGVVTARNFLGDRCETKYMLYLDADDRMQPGALAKMAAEARADRVVYGDMIWGGEGHAVKYHVFPPYDCETMFTRAILPITSIHPKAAFEKVGGFDPRFEQMLEDWDYNIRLMLAGFCGYRIPEPVMVYRQHEGARSRQDRGILYKMRQALNAKFENVRGKSMPCCGGGAVNQPKTQAQNDRLAAARAGIAATSGSMVLLEYLGKKAGAEPYNGRITGQRYLFSSEPDGRQKYVFREDAEFLLTLPQFRLAARESTGPVLEEDYKTAPQVATLVSHPMAKAASRGEGLVSGAGKPVPADDLMAIRGISRKRALMLNSIGVTRYEDLLATTANDLLEALKGAGVKGLTVAMVDAWRQVARSL
jgi:predicted flap endonuclease-1-like 5' DNA nuclease